MEEVGKLIMFPGSIHKAKVPLRNLTLITLPKKEERYFITVSPDRQSEENLRYTVMSAELPTYLNYLSDNGIIA